MSHDATHNWRGAIPAVTGGAIVAVGAVLPWMSLFAGLQSYHGISGLYGRLTFVGGIVSAAGGIVTLTRPDPRLRAAIGGLGLALTLFAAWILTGLRAMTQHLAQDPFLLPRPEPGLFVVLVGSVIVAALLLPSRRRYTNAKVAAWCSMTSRGAREATRARCFPT